MITYLNTDAIQDSSIESIKLKASTFKTINGETLFGEGDISLQTDANLCLVDIDDIEELDDVIIPNHAEKYFTVEALEDGLTAKLSTNACEYRIDNGDWNTLRSSAETVAINTGQKLQFRAELTPYSNTGIGTFKFSKKCNLKGNIMSLLYKDNFIGQTDLTGKDYAFYRLFYMNTNIINANKLVLPATTLANYCYNGMFEDCTGLTTAPELPATTLAESCYWSMFEDCTGLTTAPELPATNLMFNCYSSMFNKCTGLTTAPELPATTLAKQCYSHMFTNCTGLTTTPELPATTLAELCYSCMFWGCTGLTTAPELPATTLAKDCYGQMFQDCTGLTTAPELPATTLVNYCYKYMFKGCTNLNYIKALFTTAPSSSYTNSWVEGVSSTGTFVKNENATWDVRGTNGIPEGWTVETV